jgi:hypothetical protein
MKNKITNYDENKKNMRYLWMLQAVISPNNHFGLPE